MTAIVQGSLKDVADTSGATIHDLFDRLTACIMVDVSSSMTTHDASGGISRYDAAVEQLKRLQKDLPGKIAVGWFADKADIAISGVPLDPHGCTNMVAALEKMKVFDGGNQVKLILISDGEPDGGTETETLNLARTFSNKIDTIFVGNEMSAGATFLKELAAATGGVMMTNQTARLNELNQNIRLLLGA